MLIRTRSLLGILTVSLFTITSCLPPDQHNLDATTTNLEGDPAQEHCGFDVAEEPEGPYTDPCSDGVLILEPETFTRSKGKPQVHTKSFSVTEPGGICVLVHNCKTSAAWIGVDGFAMINPDKFNSHVSAVSATMNVAQGEHELSVRMASSPGSEITVEIRFAPVDVTPRGKVVGDNGGVSVWNLFDVPDPFSPRDVNEVKDVSTLSAMVGVLHFSGGSGFLYKLRYTFQIADSMECKQIRSVSNELVVDPTTRLEGFPVLAEWDGSTDEGIMVSDGVYFYRVVVELLRYNEDGNPVTIDRAESMIQTITVDNEPPTIGLISLIASNNGMVVLDSYTTDPLSIEGGIYDDNGVASSSLTYDGQLIAIPSEGLFNIDADMPPVIGLDFFDHKLLVFAVDHAGNEASFNVRLRLYAQHNTHRLIVRFNPYTSTLSNKSILEEIGGRIVYSDLLNRLYLIEIDPVEPIYKTANRLSNLSEVAYAIPDSPNFDNQPNDYYYGRVYSQAADNSVATSLSSWHLFNDGTGYSGRSQGYCLTDANCGWSQSCVLDGCNGFHCCQCQLGTVPEQCPAGQHCVATASGYNVCVVDAVFDADIGWLDVYDDIMGLVGNEPVVVGICEANGIFQLDHQDIVQNLYTNEIECCSSPPCNLPCTLGEVIPDRNCNSDADCDDGHSCLVVPSHGSCMDGSECNIGKHCLTNDDCGINGRCHTIDGNRICIAGFTNVVGRLCFTDSQCGIDYPGCNTF
jgi:hypothetical protein